MANNAIIITRVTDRFIEFETGGAAPPIGNCILDVKTESRRFIVSDILGYGRSRAKNLDYNVGLILGDKLIDTFKRLQVPVGKGVLGRIMNALGKPVD